MSETLISHESEGEVVTPQEDLEATLVPAGDLEIEPSSDTEPMYATDVVESSILQDQSEAYEGLTYEEFPSPEEIESVPLAAEDVSFVNDAAFAEGAPLVARANAVANAFEVGEEKVQQDLAAAPHENVDLGFTDWIARSKSGARRILQALIVSAAATAAAPAFGQNFLVRLTGGPEVTNRLNAAGEAVRIRNEFHIIDGQIRDLDRQIKDAEAQIDLLEAQVRLTSTAAGVNQEVATVENRVGATAESRQIEASYKRQMAEIKLQRTAAKERFLAIQNPTATQQAQFDLEMDTIAEHAASIQGQYEIAVARASGRAPVRQAQIGVEGAVANVQAEQIRHQQQQWREAIIRLKDQRAPLQLQKAKLIQQGTAVGVRLVGG